MKKYFTPERVVFFLLFLGVPLFLFREGFFSGKILYGYDIITLDLPFSVFAREVFSAYKNLPFWLPGIFFGIPLIDSANLIIFYPLNFFYIISNFPPHLTYTIDMVLHLFMAGAGMYLFLRRESIRKEASFLGGFIFMLSGCLVSFSASGQMGIIKAASFIPLIFYFTKRAFDSGTVLNFAAISFLLSLQVLSLGQQVMVYTAAGIIIYFIFLCATQPRSRLKKKTILFAAAIPAVALFSAPQFFPPLEYIRHSWREGMGLAHFTSWSFNPKELVSLVYPGFFGLEGESYTGYIPNNLTTYYSGILVFFLAGFGFAGEAKKKALFFSGAALLFLLASFGGYLPGYGFLYNIPLIGKFRNPSRMIYLFTFFISVLAAAGTHNIIVDRYRAKKAAIVLFSGGIFFTALFFAGFGAKLAGNAAGLLWNPDFTGTKPDALSMFSSDSAMIIVILFCGAAALQLMGPKKAVIYGLAALFCLHAADIYRVEKKFISFKKYNEVVDPRNAVAKYFSGIKKPFRAYEINPVSLPNKNIFYGIDFLNGYHGLAPKKFMELSAAGAFSKGEINRMLNVRYYLTDNRTGVKGMERVFSGPINIFRDKDAGGRFFIPGRIEVTKDSRDTLARMASYYYTKETLYVSAGAVKDTELPVLGPAEPAEIKVLKYTPNFMEVEADSPQDNILAWSSMYYPRWNVYVNGEKRKMIEVNYCLSGVKINKGKNHVVIKYDGSYIYIWMLISFILNAAFLAAAGMRLRR